MTPIDCDSTDLQEELDQSMTSPEQKSVHAFREFRAPKEHGQSLISPRLDRVPELLSSNLDVLRSQRLFESIRREARRLLIDDAVRYTATYRDVSWFDQKVANDAPILMAGHQPAMFHAGVWFKNFALSHLARQTSSVAVNLVIDNDVASGSSIRVPGLDPVTGQGTYHVVPYDRAGGGVPYEQSTIKDREVFDHFDREVRRAVAPLVRDPCVDRLWKHARHAIERCGFAGCALAQARHGLEGEIGLQTLELPMGVVCRTTAFAEFVLMILSELPRFRQCYNDAARCYRKAHHIRSSAHPVPDLAEEEGWFEAPLWIYGNDSPQRKAAWARLSDDELVISDRAGREIRVDIRYPKLAAEKLSSQIGPNLKLRPRALLTTMYARLVLSDLFLHGIGGGKYDQLGDLIMSSFFGITPPQFMVVSATVLLSGLAEDSSVDRIADLQRMIRDTKYQPERFADRFDLGADLIQRKRGLLANLPERGSRSGWHRQIEEVNDGLSQPLRGFRAGLRADLAAARRQAASHEWLGSREHPFCIFPLPHLVETYAGLLAEMGTGRDAGDGAQLAQ